MGNWKSINSEICMSTFVNTRYEKERTEIRNFWNVNNECLMEIGRGSRIVSIGMKGLEIVRQYMQMESGA